MKSLNCAIEAGVVTQHVDYIIWCDVTLRHRMMNVN
jgi:hypothetical protein